MSVLSAALAAALAIAAAAMPSPVVEFDASSIAPIHHAPGMFIVPSLTRHSGAGAALAIAVPSSGVVLFAEFACDKHLFRLSGIGEASDGGGGKIAIGEIHPSSGDDAKFSPTKDSPWGVAAETAACGAST